MLILGCGLLPTMSHDQGFKKVMWISLRHGLIQIADHDHEKSFFILLLLLFFSWHL